MKKQWVRIVISLIIGGGFQEFVRIRTGRDNNASLFVVAIISYIVLSIAVHYHTIYTLQKKVDRKNYINDEIIDDLK